MHSRTKPSYRYRELLDQYRQLHEENVFGGSVRPREDNMIARLAGRHGARTMLDYGCGQATKHREPVTINGDTYPAIKDFWGVESVVLYDPGRPEFATPPTGRFDGVSCTDVLEHVPEQDIPWVLQELFAFADKFVFASVAIAKATKTLPNGENAHCTVKPVNWWIEQLGQAAATRPGIDYLVSVWHPTDSATVHSVIRPKPDGSGAEKAELVKAPVDTLGTVLTLQDLMRITEPFVYDYGPKTDPSWAQAEQLFLNKVLQARPSADVRQEWENAWTGTSRLTPEFLVPEGNPAPPWEWRDQGLLLRPGGGPRARIMALKRALEARGPKSVLEAGCGDGLNLFALAGGFPDTRFTGMELTTAGVDGARAYQSQDPFPQAMLDYACEPRDPTAVRRIVFEQGSCEAMPYDDDRFDVVMTCVALEQMESFRDKALAELRRVSSKWVVMMEPFAEANTDRIRSEHVRRAQYFSASIADLRHHGLKPVYVTGDFPQKLVLGTALVVARKI